jgi:hypothetical protein
MLGHEKRRQPIELPRIGSWTLISPENCEGAQNSPTEFCAPWANETQGKVERSLVIPFDA